MLAILRSLDGARRAIKLGIVLAGYALALAAAVAGAMIYDSRFSPADNQAMGGMIAFGELTFGAGVFAVLALLPTALALWFVRRHRPTWNVFSVACLAFALAAVVGVPALLTGGPDLGRTPAIALMALFGLVQMLGSPVWIGSFALFALLAPERSLSRRMFVAAAIEVVIGICALLHFLPAHAI
jgi:hypothetical protein